MRVCYVHMYTYVYMCVMYMCIHTCTDIAIDHHKSKSMRPSCGRVSAEPHLRHRPSHIMTALESQVQGYYRNLVIQGTIPLRVSCTCCPFCMQRCLPD